MRFSSFFAVGLLVFGASASIIGACTTFGADGPAEPDGSPPPDDSAVPDAAGRPDGTPLLDARADGDTPDADDNDAGTCSRVAEGTSKPCFACEQEVVTDLGTQFAFSLAADVNHVYWIENANRDGNAEGGTVKRIAVRGDGDAAAPNPETVWSTTVGIPNKLVLVANDVLVAFAANEDRPAVRIGKDCANRCTPQPIVGSSRVRAITHLRGGPVTVEPTLVRVGASSYSFSSPARAGVDAFGNEIAVVRNAQVGIEATRGIMLPSGSYFPLAPDPDGGGTSSGALFVAADCRGLWALQDFGGGQHALVYTLPNAANRRASWYFTRQTFGIAADATHIYAAHSDGVGLYRASETEEPKEIVVGDIWSIAITNKYVYYDRHTRMSFGPRRIERIRKAQ